jgi:hypothetical protein
MDAAHPLRPLNRRTFAARTRVRWTLGVLAAGVVAFAVAQAIGVPVIDVVMLGSTVVGLQTVAEGIETREQLDQLQALGRDLGQGYLARPMDAAKVPGYLQPGAEQAA